MIVTRYKTKMNSEEDDDDFLSQTQKMLFSDERTDKTSQAKEEKSSEKASECVKEEDVSRCLVCSLNISRLSIFEKECHLNSCLDRIESGKSMKKNYECPSCGRNLTDYNQERRAAHVNLCLDHIATNDKQEQNSQFDDTSEVPSSLLPTESENTLQVQTTGACSSNEERSIREDSYKCRICAEDLTSKSLSTRIQHLKQCGRRFGVLPHELRVVSSGTDLDPNVEESSDRKENFSATKDSPDCGETEASSVDTSAQKTIDSFAVMMRAASSRSSTFASTEQIGRQASSNVFDVLMKSAKTQKVLSTSLRTNSTQSFSWGKKRRISGENGLVSASASTSFPFRRKSGAPRCPEFKKIKGTSPPFVVDGFKFACKSLSNTYFLTHFHSDHYGGLEKNFDCGIIYCNEITGRLVTQELGIDSKYIHPVPMNTPVLIHDVQVTFMDANHCPGATIILFRLKSGATFLHTGDFRFHPKMLEYPTLKRFVHTESSTEQLQRLDGVYLDTTYADPKYSFPLQDVAIEAVLKIMEEHLPVEKTLFLFGSYSVGKERLFMEVARRFEKKVLVSKSKRRLIACYGWPEEQERLLTTEPVASDIHVVPMRELNMQHLSELLLRHRLRYHRILAFRPTGWTFSSKQLVSSQTDVSGKIKIFGVPYSEHSSFSELCEFVKYMNPVEIIPTVNCYQEKNVKKQIESLRRVAFHSIRDFF